MSEFVMGNDEELNTTGVRHLCYDWFTRSTMSRCGRR